MIYCMLGSTGLAVAWALESVDPDLLATVQRALAPIRNLGWSSGPPQHTVPSSGEVPS